MNFLILFTEFLVFLDQNEKNGRRIKIFACNSQMGFGIFWKKKIEPFFCSPGGIAVFVFGIEIGWNFLVTFRFLNVAGLRWAPLVFVGFQIFPLAATFFRIGANAFEVKNFEDFWKKFWSLKDFSKNLKILKIFRKIWKLKDFWKKFEIFFEKFENF